MRGRSRRTHRWIKGKNFHRRFYKSRRGRQRDNTFTNRNPKYREWKKAVHVRDGRCCQLCGTHKKRFLQAHHIRKKSLHPDLAFEVGNGISLCKRCHMKIVDRHEEVFEPLFDLAIEAGQPLPYSLFVWFNSLIFQIEPMYCECGCGQPTRLEGRRHRRFLKGHHRREPTPCPNPLNSSTPGTSPAQSVEEIHSFSL
jgi:5-methylcytosine-specific restriction endonuclease McrA